MIRHPSHRSSATRVLIGGALAAGLAGASAAWACTPQAFTVPRDQASPVLPGADVVIEGHVYTHSVIDKDVNGMGRQDLDDVAALGAAFRPVEVEVHAGSTAEEARSSQPLTVRQAPAYVESTRLQGPEFEAKVKLTSPGLNYLWTFAVNQSGELVRPQPFAYNVQSATAPAPAADEAPAAEGAPAVTPPAPQTVTRPATPGGTATAPTASQPTSAPAAGVTGPSTKAPAAAATTSAPGARPASTPAAVATARPAPAGSAAPVLGSEEAAQSPAPQTTDLWSGLDRSSQAPSLLDGNGTTTHSTGSPIGTGLLGISVLAMAGVAAVAGKRKLAVSRRSR